MCCVAASGAELICGICWQGACSLSDTCQMNSVKCMF
jgi:hypothetical protein